jgi:hypothetical protein
MMMQPYQKGDNFASFAADVYVQLSVIWIEFEMTAIVVHMYFKNVVGIFGTILLLPVRKEEIASSKEDNI